MCMYLCNSRFPVQESCAQIKTTCTEFCFSFFPFFFLSFIYMYILFMYFSLFYYFFLSLLLSSIIYSFLFLSCFPLQVEPCLHVLYMYMFNRYRHTGTRALHVTYCTVHGSGRVGSPMTVALQLQTIAQQR